MSRNLTKYIDEVKNKLESDLLSPNYIRLANLYYLNAQFDECLETCKAILIIYPDYLTAKIIMLKALLKLRFINEAENLFNEIYSKIEGLDIFTLFKEVIEELKKSEPQEKIFYPASSEITSSFRKFSAALDQTDLKNEEIILSDYINENEILSSEDFINKKSLSELKKQYSSFVFPPKPVSRSKDKVLNPLESGNDEKSSSSLQHFSLKIVTETIAELYANQGNYEEAFEAYQLLLKTRNIDKAKVQSRLTDIEKLISRKQKI
ncbi:hypothetical protein BH10BAC5_BH10BAC5_08150 [soil metagenome]